MVFVRYFWQGNYQIYGHIRCMYTRSFIYGHIRSIYTVLAYPSYFLVRGREGECRFVDEDGSASNCGGRGCVRQGWFGYCVENVRIWVCEVGL
jgi:hypothetical protein